MLCVFFVFFKQKTAEEMRISDWSSDVCSSDRGGGIGGPSSGSALGGRADVADPPRNGEGDHAKHGGGAQPVCLADEIVRHGSVAGNVRSIQSGAAYTACAPPPPYGWSPSPCGGGSRVSASGRFRPKSIPPRDSTRSEEHTSELPSLMRISYAVFFLKKK